MNKLVALFLSLLSVLIVSSQEKPGFSGDPSNAKFITADVDRFYAALDRLESGGKPFKGYIDEGSKGLQGFLAYRIYNADSLLKTVRERKQEYINGRDNLRGLDSKKKRIRASYAAMKYWYPDAVFPPIYFVVGRFNSGGTVSEDGIILGHEMQHDLEGLPGLVAHELIHFQQEFQIDENHWNLLASSLNEGGADFIGELISGQNINALNYKFGEQHLEKLALEFVVSMEKDDNTDWLYGTSGKDHRPNDLGYWMGYKITKAYFDKATDKKQAIYDILHIADAKAFLEKSGFLKPYQEQVGKMDETERKALLVPFPSKKVTATFTVTVPNADDVVYITGNHKNLGNWNPSAVKMTSISDYKRQVTLEINSPATFKFTRGSWGSQALVKDVDGIPNLTFVEGGDEPNFSIEKWSDENN